MPWKKGVSGNPQGRRIEVARKALYAEAINPSENVYIPILDKRDPAKELIKLADNHTDKRYKMEIWMFLFAQKYKASKIVSKPLPAIVEDEMSDEDTLRLLENKAVESNPVALQKNVGDGENV